MKKLAMLLLLAGVAQAQSVHKVTLTWQEPVSADVYRSQSTCDQAGSFAKLASAVPSGYVDTTVSSGLTYCYYAIEQPSNVPTNLLEVEIPSDALVAIKTAKQTAGATAQ